MSTIPAFFQEKILKLVRWQDRQNSLTGKLLLQYGLENLIIPPLNIESVQISSYGKPFIHDGIYFNISHSGCCTICAFNSSEIGIDVEAIRTIQFKDFFSIFSIKEQNSVLNSTDSLRSFYDIWTCKESVVKAQGNGLTNNLTAICFNGNHAKLNNDVWHLYPIRISPKYISNIAVKDLNPRIYIKYVSFQ